MILAYAATFLITTLALLGLVSPLVSEVGFTLLLGVTALKLYGLAKRSRDFAWQRGIVAMALAAASAATVAWFLADALYLSLPGASADMAFNSLALVQWGLFYRAASVYVARRSRYQRVDGLEDLEGTLSV